MAEELIEMIDREADGSDSLEVRSFCYWIFCESFNVEFSADVVV
jgi:hypothetical protein